MIYYYLFIKRKMYEGQTLLNINNHLVREENHTSRYAKQHPIITGLKRTIPNVITMILELLNAFIILQYTETLVNDPVLIGFLTVISAVSGDIGLQTSSATTRVVDFKEYYKGCCSQLGKELISVISQSSILFILYGIICSVWTFYLDKENYLMYGFVMSISLLISNIFAGIMGTLTPLFFNHVLKVDPTHFAGPLETTFQDIVGYLVTLNLAKIFL